MVYVLSDIHGNMRRLRSILEQIQLSEEDTLYILGDVIDRNPDGIEILRWAMAAPNVRMLLGNHELMMLGVLYYPAEDSEEGRALKEFQTFRWERNSGGITRTSFERLGKSERLAILRYLDGLPVNEKVTVNGVDYLLTHAAPLELYPQYGEGYRTGKEFAVWWRGFTDSVPEGDYVTVFGHTTTHHFQEGDPMSIWYGHKMIDIDCGSSYPDDGDPDSGIHGRLACLRLDDGKVFYSREAYDAD